MISKVIAMYKLGGFMLIILKSIDILFQLDLSTRYLYKIARNLDEKDYLGFLVSYYKYYTGEILDLKNPQTFNQKIQWLKLFDRNKLKTVLADKYLVRDWIKEKLGSEYLVPLLGVYDSINEIKYEKLPNQFVIKANHGSGMNIIIKDKTIINIKNITLQFNKWLKQNHAFLFGLELQYKDIKPKIIIEEYIEQLDKNLLDYKIHCFNGEPRIIQVIGNRDYSSHSAEEAFFDTNWKPKELMYRTYKQYTILPNKPVNLDEMLHVARIISKEFIYVRVDLYNINSKIIFGEMTFTPMSGFGKWLNPNDNLLVGKMIKLPISSNYCINTM